MILDYEKFFESIEDFKINKKKKTEINREIKKFLLNQKLKANTIYQSPQAIHAVPHGDTGKLRDALNVGRVKGNATTGYSLNMGVDKIKTSGKPAEWKYPLYVEEGTREKITSKRRNGFLRLRNKKKNFVFAKRRSVPGQEGQFYFAAFKGRMRANFSLEEYRMMQRINKIITK